MNKHFHFMSANLQSVWEKRQGLSSITTILAETFLWVIERKEKTSFSICKGCYSRLSLDQWCAWLSNFILQIPFQVSVLPTMNIKIVYRTSITLSGFIFHWVHTKVLGFVLFFALVFTILWVKSRMSMPSLCSFVPFQVLICSNLFFVWASSTSLP